MQLNSERFRQDEFNGEPAQRTRVREHRRIQKNSLVSSFMNDAIRHFFRAIQQRRRSSRNDIENSSHATRLQRV
nr:palindromic element RPE3 domain-containing protein [Rickettsia endosymbiont of Ceutorhynchus assimilis]